MNRERLLNVARALRESPNPEKFTMGLYGSSYDSGCGTPACALGHYAAREDLQDEFRLRRNDVLLKKPRPGFEPGDYGAVDLAYYYDEVIEHFGIFGGDAEELFGGEGCGDARTTVEAAEFIERWVAEHEAKS